MCVCFRISSLEDDLELVALPPPPSARRTLLAQLHNLTRRQEAAPASAHADLGYKPLGLLRAYVSLQKGNKTAAIARQKG